MAMVGATAFAQVPGSLVWTAGPDLPSPRAEGVAVLAPDHAVLLLGGLGPSGDRVVPRLPKGAASWTTAPDLESTRIAPGAVRYATQGIPVYGGRSGNEPTDEALRYDYPVGDSQDAEKMSVGRHQFAFAADGSGRAYALGGLGEPGVILPSAERYTPFSDTWTGIAPLPDARYGATAVTVANTHIYVLGGATSGGIQSAGYRYVIASDEWELTPPMPLAVRNGKAVLSQDRIYLTGGVSAAGPVATVQVYDLATGLWTIDTPLPEARYAHAAVLGPVGQLLIAGGYDAAGTASDAVWQSQRLDVPETPPLFTTSPVTAGSLDSAYSYDAGAVGNPPPSFSLGTAPSGMRICTGDSASGILSWLPTPDDAGAVSVTVGEEGVIFRPDPEGKDTPRGSYRLVAP
jgi:N-acetylneuraminic acid mutarotase